MTPEQHKLIKVVGGPDSMVTQSVTDAVKHLIAQMPENERGRMKEFACGIIHARMNHVYDLNHTSPKGALEKMYRYVMDDNLWHPPTPIQNTPTQVSNLDNFDLDTLDLSEDDLPNITTTMTLKQVADNEAQKYADSGKLFYVQKGVHDERTIVFVGSALISVPDTKEGGLITLDVGCTVSNYLNVKGAPAELVLRNSSDRQIVGVARSENGSRYFTRIFTHENGRTFRCYMVTVKDGERSSNKKELHGTMDNSPDGYHVLKG